MKPTDQEGKQCTEVAEAPQVKAKLSQVIQIDEGKIQEHLGEVVRSMVEETLNALLDAEADRLCRAVRTDRSAEGYASGFLRAAPPDESRRSHAEGAEAAHAAV